MSILVNSASKIVCQGITGSQGTFHTEQCIDYGTQVVAVGIMRGMGDTHVPMLIHVAGFWAVAIPVGCWFAFVQERGAVGPWFGLVAGLALVAVAQFLRLRYVLRRGIQRIVIDAPDSSDSSAPSTK